MIACHNSMMDSRNFELAHLKKKTNYAMAVWQLSGSVMLFRFRATRSLVDHETLVLKEEWYIVLRLQVNCFCILLLLYTLSVSILSLHMEYYV